MNLLKKAYFQKSFFNMGTSRKECFDCKYCRLLDGDTANASFLTAPVEINKQFNNIPVAVNLFRGDPLHPLQLKHTIYILSKLEKLKHKGAIIIITKGDLKLFPHIPFDLDIHFALSTFGMNHPYDGGSLERFISNIIEIKKRPYKASIEFRPIIYRINDSKEVIKNVLAIANNYNLAVGYSGLQGKPEVVKIWETEELKIMPYPGTTFGHKKFISEEVEDIIIENATRLNVPVFRKTSCLISYVHGLERDINAHYYRPLEVGCEGCKMQQKCFSFYNSLSINKKLNVEIPFNYKLVYKEKHECILKKQNICNFPTAECSNIKGVIMEIADKLTTSDVRLIKWLTGITVSAEFIESPYISRVWKN